RLAIVERKLVLAKARAAADENEFSAAMRRHDAEQITERAQEKTGELAMLETKIRGLQQELAKHPASIRVTKSRPNPEVEAARTELARLKAERAVALGVYLPTSPKVQDLDDQISN